MRRSIAASLGIILVTAACSSGTKKRTIAPVATATAVPTDIGASPTPSSVPAAGALGSAKKSSKAKVSTKAVPSITDVPINRNTYQGVTDKEIAVAVGYQPEPCGQDPSQIMARALPNPDPVESTKVLVDWFNKHPLDAFGDIIPDAVRSQFSTGYYGRTVKATMAPDHGQFCPEQSLEDARKAADTIKPFMSVGGSDSQWDDTIVQRKIVRIHAGPALDKYFVDRKPYLWGPISGASDINYFLAGYVAKQLKPAKTINTGDPATSNKDRVFGIIHLDDAEGHADVEELKSELAKRGVTNVKTFGYEPKLETIGAQATNAMVQMSGAGVTTILMVMDPIAVLFMTQAADSQRYHPEWISNTYGLFDWSLGPRSFMSAAQARNTFGISAFWPSRQIKIDDQPHYKIWKAAHPDKDVPGGFFLGYITFLTLFRGVALAGATLTPDTFEKGLFTFCHPCKRTDQFTPLASFGPGDYTPVDDAHKQRYDPNEPDYAAERSEWENGQPPKGAYVYVDGGKRYTSFD
jgi:hypothetical protein